MELAGALDSRIRRWLQNPRKMLAPFVRVGMTALDYGCGPGFFTLDMAQLVGESGRVIAADLQQEMLDIVAGKLRKRALENRVKLHKCGGGEAIQDKADFVLLFYVLHEVPDKAALFRELDSVLKPDGRILLVEPPLHVSKRVFAEELGIARDAGFVPVGNMQGFSINKAALLGREVQA